ISHDVGI
ncbi:CPXV205 protein, partial [Monkeypox virus]